MTKRILHVVTTMDYGGVETLLMNIYRKLDRDIIQFDFLCMNTCENLFSNEIHQLGGRMYAVPFMTKVGYWGYIKELRSFFRNHPEYKVIHAHNNEFNGLVLQVANEVGIPIRIAHSHTCGNRDKDKVKYYFKQYLKSKIDKNATQTFACSVQSRDEFYKNKYQKENCIILKNAIQTNMFSFDKVIRENIRNEYGAKGRKVLGHVGNFIYAKNQIFAIKILESMKENDPDIVLWLIGDGKERLTLEKYVVDNQLTNHVKFLGRKSNIMELMSAMDIFLFPSNYEGFGIVALEAQSCGLPVVASEAVPIETQVTDLIEYLSLESIDSWITRIEELYTRENLERSKYSSIVKEAGYDIENTVKVLVDMYTSALESIV